MQANKVGLCSVGKDPPSVNLNLNQPVPPGREKFGSQTSTWHDLVGNLAYFDLRYRTSSVPRYLSPQAPYIMRTLRTRLPVTVSGSVGLDGVRLDLGLSVTQLVCLCASKESR
ncbi:hypothetical protein M0657_003513 [Pyricularia oryzae]|uniref:Uncharacterized protein n=2 Tax=Pyricularia oryzae TaxID=318829 RepID=A0AA97NNE7_PYRO3|nr:hypothetical protein OOU_Y34scaffold00979g79 [Pyricularia oryzae Y34]KAI7919394.1 hypothetical protein M9X92_006398 [Pyricularia oryzae]KAI7926936.1 hypothetical protein M0657_003513 [Pyricularia oryzae]